MGCSVRVGQRARARARTGRPARRRRAARRAAPSRTGTSGRTRTRGPRGTRCSRRRRPCTTTAPGRPAATAAHLGADLLDRPDELVAQARPGREAERLARVEDVEVRAADAGHRHPHDRVGRLPRSPGSGTSSTRTSCDALERQPLHASPSRRTGRGGYPRLPARGPARLGRGHGRARPHAALADRFRAEPHRARVAITRRDRARRRAWPARRPCAATPWPATSRARSAAPTPPRARSSCS